MTEKEKPFSLILLDLIFWIFPDAEVFGETARDLLSCEQFITLNILLTKPINRVINKKLRKLRDSLEIHGYMMKVENAQQYHMSWHNFENKFIKRSVSTGIIQRIGSDEHQIRILMISPDKFHEYNPIFRCNMLKMGSVGQLSLIDIAHLSMDGNRLSSSKICLMKEVLEDIYNRNVTPIKSIKIGTGYEDRFKRSEMVFMLIELMEKGWNSTFDLTDCGFNLSIHHLKMQSDIDFEYPNIKRTYRRLILNDLSVLVASTDSKREVKEDICPICQESLSLQSTVKLSCTHIFHNFCIYQHFHKIGSNSDLCPICRAQVVRETRQIRALPSVATESSTDEDQSETDSSTSEIDGVAPEEISEEEITEEEEELEVIVTNYDSDHLNVD